MCRSVSGEGQAGLNGCSTSGDYTTDFPTSWVDSRSTNIASSVPRRTIVTLLYSPNSYSLSSARPEDVSFHPLVLAADGDPRKFPSRVCFASSHSPQNYEEYRIGAIPGEFHDCIERTWLDLGAREFQSARVGAMAWGMDDGATACAETLVRFVERDSKEQKLQGLDWTKFSATLWERELAVRDKDGGDGQKRKGWGGWVGHDLDSCWRL